MNKIQILDESVSNIIAAGEVVENPASMIKELIENSLDAEATMITIDVKNSGRYVKLNDNGCGMSREDLFLSIERHATSKIRAKDDIFNLYTYGFRGEALASIASVAKLVLTSKTKEDQSATKLNVSAGSITKVDSYAAQVGTEIEVKELFFNTPARLKFLRSKGTEYNKIKNVVLTEALVNYDTAFSLSLDGKEVIKTSGRGIKNTIIDLFSPQVLRGLKEFNHGFIGDMNLLRASKDYIFTYINGRYVKSAIIEKAIIDAYYTKLMKGKYPFAIIFLNIDPREIDVNVHPSKKIVKFSNDTKVYSLIKNSVEEALAENEREAGPIFSLEAALEDKKEDIDNSIKTSFEEEESVPDFLKKEGGLEEKKEYNDFKRDYIKTEKQKLPEIEKIEVEIEEPKNLLKEGVEIYNPPKKEKKEISIELEEQGTKTEGFEIESKSESRNYRIIGQLRNMYILVENKGELEIYDQHIVHERILYEELKEKHYNKNIGIQNLLVPLKVEVDYKEKELVMENLSFFNEFGYELEEFGSNEILIRSKPIFDFRASIKETFYYILSKIREGDKRDIREKIIISMSCKNAIKAGETLGYKEMELLLKKLHDYGKYTCPHGRPIIIKLSYNELDKMFGRK